MKFEADKKQHVALHIMRWAENKNSYLTGRHLDMTPILLSKRDWLPDDDPATAIGQLWTAVYVAGTRGLIQSFNPDDNLDVDGLLDLLCELTGC